MPEQSRAMSIRSILVLLLPLTAAAADAIHLYHNNPPTLLSVPQNTSFTLDSFNSTARRLPVPATGGAEWTLLSPFLLGGEPGEPLRAYKISSGSPPSSSSSPSSSRSSEGGEEEDLPPLKRVGLATSGNEKALAHSGPGGFINSNSDGDGDKDGDGEGEIYLLGGECDGMQTSIQQHISPNKPGRATVEQHEMGLPPASGFTLTPLGGGRQLLFVGGVASGKEVSMGSVGVRDNSTGGDWRFVRAAGGDSIDRRSGHTAVSLGARVYVYGGWRSDGKPARPRLVVLDTEAWRWSVPSGAGPGPKTGRRHGAAMLDGGVMLVVGREVGLFDTASGRWVRAYPVPDQGQPGSGQSGPGRAGIAWKRLGVVLGVAFGVALGVAAAGVTVWACHRRRRHKPNTAKRVPSNDGSDDDGPPPPQQQQQQQQQPQQQQHSGGSSPLIPLASSTPEPQLTRSTSAPQPLAAPPLLPVQLLSRRPVSLPGEIGHVETGTLVRAVGPGKARIVDLPTSSSSSSSSSSSLVLWVTDLPDGGETGGEGEDENGEDAGYQTADEDVLTTSWTVAG